MESYKHIALKIDAPQEKEVAYGQKDAAGRFGQL